MMLILCLLSLLAIGPIKAAENPRPSTHSEVEVTLEERALDAPSILHSYQFGTAHILHIKNNSAKSILIKAHVVKNAASLASIIADFNWRISGTVALFVALLAISGKWAHIEFLKQNRWWANYSVPIMGMIVNGCALKKTVYDLYSTKKDIPHYALQEDIRLEPGQETWKLFWLNDAESSATLDRSAIEFIE